LQDQAVFPTILPFPIEHFYTSADYGDHQAPILRVGVVPGGEYFGFFYSDGTQFAVERQGREILASWPENFTLEDACTYLLGPVLGFVLRLRGVTCLHASAVAVGDYAVALAGAPGVGKSTTAAAFARCGFLVLSDDIVALTEGREHFIVELGYPRLNLWPDSVGALFGSEDSLPRITPSWDKRFMSLDQNGHVFASNPLPLGAIYFLGAREEALTAPVIEEVAGSEAVVALVANTYANHLLDRDMRSREFDALSRAIARVPIRRVRPPAESAALFGLCEAIATDAERLFTSQGPAALLSRR
jgi:hypothetical protein